jgi:hypothetical protein
MCGYVEGIQISVWDDRKRRAVPAAGGSQFREMEWNPALALVYIP